MTHEKVLDQLSMLIDGELSAKETAEVKEHLATCASCREVYEELQFIHETMTDMPLLELPDGFEAELHEKLLEASKETQDQPTADTAQRKVLQIPLPSFRDVKRYYKPLTAVAATLLIAFVGFSTLQSGMFDRSMESAMEEGIDANMATFEMAEEAPAQAKMAPSVQSVRAADSVSVTFNKTVQPSNDVANYSLVQESEESFGAADDGATVTFTVGAAESAPAQPQPEMDSPEAATSKSADAKSKVDQRMIIYTANANLEVEDYDLVYDQLFKDIEARGGYISSAETQYKYYDRDNEENSLKQGWLTVRVPADQLVDFLESLKLLGRGPEPGIHANDITDQYRDVASEVANLEVREKKLREIMEQAEDVKDVLEVERELSRVRGEINSYMGTLTQWDRLVQLSTVHIYLDEVESFEPVVKPIDKNIFQKASDGFKESMNTVKRWFERAFIGTVASVPILIVWAIALALLAIIVRIVWKRYTKNK